MSDFFATEDDYANLVSKVGASKAAQMAREQGWSIRPKEVKFTPAMGGGDQMEDEDLNVADEDAADNAAAGAYASLGGLSAMDLTDPKQISRAILANAAEQRKYYDDLANQIKQRRYGPSESEKLLALSSAFFAPTSVRGFSGTMGNVLPVLQKFGELRRTGEQERAEALQNLAKQRMALAQGDIKTAIDLQRLLATYNKPKPKGAQARAVSNPQGRNVHSRYGTYIIPPNEEDLYNGRAFMNNPDVPEERKKEFRREWNKNYGVGADEIYLDDVAGGDE